MKLTKIALAVACVLGSVQAFAAPVTQAQIVAAKTAGTLQQAWISGASAPTRSIFEGWVGSGTGVGCDVGTNAIFVNQSSTSTATVPGALGNFLAYACTRAGVVSVLYHTVDGGSLNAFTPHTVGTKLARIGYAGSVACTQTTSYVDTTNTENNATLYKGCALVGAALPSNGVATVASNAANATALAADANGPQNPVGGFSDVEPTILPATLGGGDAAVGAKGVATAANYGQAFGVIVSKPLYRALQVKQGITANTDALDPTFDPANAPSISREQYAAIAVQGGAYQTDWTPLVGAAGTGHKVILARRVNSSGTQASSSAFFLGNPCSTGGLTPAAAADTTSISTSTATGIEVFEGAGTSNVKTRISTASNSTGTDNFAIGVVSLENDWRADTSTATNGYRFVKLDGVHPEAGDTANARVTATTGSYLFHMESYNFVANATPTTPSKAFTAFEAGIIPAITSALVAPPTAASCAVLPRGLTLNPAAGSICTVGVQVMNGTNFGNSCSPIQLTQ